MCNWSSSTSGGGVILIICKLTGSLCTRLPVGWSNNRMPVALRKHRGITEFTQLSNILSVVRLSSPSFVLLQLPSLFLFYPSHLQDRGVGAMIGGRISVSSHPSLKLNVLFISIQDPMSLYSENMHALLCK